MKRVKLKLKKKNKNGFTLIELIIAISILAVIIAFALPNITSTLENYKKEQMIIDAKDMVEKAKNYILINKPEGKEVFYLSEIDSREEIKNSPFGNNYIDGSYIEIVKKTDTNSNTTTIYKIYLSDGTMCIGKNEPVDISDISIENVSKCNS